MAGLYFHIPFCKRVCAYCDFFKSADLRRLGDTLAAMHDELDRQREYLGGESLRTIYFGGGTPSLCSPQQIGGLLEHAAGLFDCSAVEETTLEANPDDLDGPRLEAWRKAGIDRLSIGIQSMDDACLRLMNRRHTAAQAVEAVETARAAGFDNITVDLIYGVPGFTGDSLRRSLDVVLRLRPEHVSAYHLTVEPDTAFGRRAARGEFVPVEEQVSEEEFEVVHRTLAAAGYEHYEVSNFALPGRRARHNAAYWRGEKYLGIGPAAHSYDGSERHWNVASVERYIAGEPPGREVLTDRDRFNEYLMTRLRTAEGIDTDETARLFGAARAERTQRDAARFVAAGTLVAAGGRLAVPPERWLVSDAVIGALFESDDSC
ncbi:MAG: radical SAM family heme chaperone HemW [Alistipes sp.]|nr:radical SAM family heme chaperone HemW [Alistipes sp.]